jgi:hypothetical protein
VSEDLQAALAAYNAELEERKPREKPRKILNAPLPPDKLLTPGARKR